MHAITVFFITLILGPGIFWLLCKTVYRKRPRRYPEFLVDGIGDTVFIPLFNAVAFYYGISWVYPILAFVFALVITSAWGIYRVYIEKNIDWTVLRKHRLNFGGWYHLVWFFAESFIIISVLLEYYANIWVWLPLIAYLLTSFYTYAFQVHNWFKIKK